MNFIAEYMRIGFLLFLLSIPLLADGQQKYWIYFNHENHPVKKCRSGSCRAEHLKQLALEKIDPLVYSNWLEAASAVLTPDQLPELGNRLWIDSIRPLDRELRILSSDNGDMMLGSALEQIRADTLVQAGLTGAGIRIGIIDAGFYRADRQKSLEHVLEKGGFSEYRNFVEPELSDPFSGPKNNDYHGTRVWQLIAGYRPDRNEILGLARDATFYLARTDEDPREYRGEEDFWIAAVEWMASQGVRLINSSLGYADGHDDPAEDYLPSDADGKSSALTKFAQIAVMDKGLLIIMSAGNSGNEPFRVVNIPADAPGIVAVGATGLNFWTRQEYSSVGRHTLPVIKPDISCFSASGTSFAAPVITGMAACLMQADSVLTNLEIAAIIRSSGNLSAFPNNFLGFGVPDARKALAMIGDQSLMNTEGRVIQADNDEVVIRIETEDPVIFHKSDQWNVEYQEALPGKRNAWTIRRPDATVERSTFATNSDAVEIIWPD